MAEYIRLADALGIPKLDKSDRETLRKLLGSADAVAVVEAVARLGNHRDAEDHKDMRKAVLGLLRKEGVKRSRGKRTSPNLEAFVECMTPLFLHFGVPLSTAESGALVRGLRIVATAMGVEQDPRNELRRLVALDRRLAGEHRQRVARILADAFRRFFGPDVNRD
jgi:hypothetical protein